MTLEGKKAARMPAPCDTHDDLDHPRHDDCQEKSLEGSKAQNLSSNNCR